MTKKFKIFCLIVLLFSFFLFKGVNADSGWDGSYDSGGSSYYGGSGYYGGSSYDWGSYGSDYESSYSGGTEYSSYGRSSNSGIYLGKNGDYIWIIIILVLFLSIGLFSSESKTKNKKGISYNGPNVVPFDIEKIKAVLPEFSKDIFKYRVYAIYKRIQESWMNFDYDTLRKYTTDELYNAYKSQLTTLSVKNQKNIMKDFVLKDFEIESMEVVDGKISIIIRMMVECFDYVVDKNNAVVRGNNKQKVSYDYQMTFIKGVSEKLNKCPNCNAPLENVNRSKCPYCDSIILNDNYDWILSKKRVVGQTENKN